MLAMDRMKTLIRPSPRALSMRPVEVAACVVRNPAGHVLMARRRADQSSPGCWEIPGGKIEPGESAAQAALRELHEETGLSAQGLRPLIRHIHDFPTRRIHLSVFEAAACSGLPTGIEGNELAWVDPAQPAVGPILPSNLRVLARLALPMRVALVTPPAADPALWARDCVARALRDGVGALYLHDPRLTMAQSAALARRLCASAAPRGLLVWHGSRLGRDFRPVFARGRAETRPAFSGDGLRAAVIDPAAADRPGALEGLDVVLLPLPATRTALPDWHANLARIARTTSAALYPVLADGMDPDPDMLIETGAYGVCLAEPSVSLNAYGGRAC